MIAASRCSLLPVLAILAACGGQKGPTGSVGPTGPTGPAGASGATSGNVANAIVARDGTGSFAAESITLSGNLGIPGPSGSTTGNILSNGLPVLSADETNSNVFIGVGAVVPVQVTQLPDVDGGTITTGVDNTGVGAGALASNTTGTQNTSIGAGSLNASTTGSFNVSLGYEALFDNGSGSSNIAIGYSALPANQTGTSNVAVGTDALFANTDGNGNIAVGDSAGFDLASGDDNIYIGSKGPSGRTSETGAIRIGDPATQSATYIAGIAGNVSAGSSVCVDSNGALGVCGISSARYKEDIHDMGDASRVLMDLRPVSFRYKPEYDPECRPEFGLIAEEVARKAPELATYDADGRPNGVRYNLVNAMLLNEVQRQQGELDAQRAEAERRHAAVESIVERQQREIEALTQRLDAMERGR